MSVLLEFPTPTSSGSPLVQWLTGQIINNSHSLAHSGAAIKSLPEKISEAFSKNPIQEWEADRWLRGIKLRLIKMEAYFIRVGDAKAAPLSLFVRNDRGLNVGLRRETITQMATFVSLITDFGFSRRRTRFETKWMDVVVQDQLGDTFIYAETKASAKTLSKLCGRLESEFRSTIPPLLENENGRVTDDPLMKAHHIWKNKPVFFWGVSPESRQAYEVIYETSGFWLKTIKHLPDAQAASAPNPYETKHPF